MLLLLLLGAEPGSEHQRKDPAEIPVHDLRSGDTFSLVSDFALSLVWGAGLLEILTRASVTLVLVPLWRP